MVGIITEHYARRADFYDYVNLLEKPEGFTIYVHERSPARGRNIIIDEAIKHNCTHILFIDDDQAFEPRALKQLLKHDVDIVSGLYLSRAYPHTPLIFDVADDEGACLPVYLDPNDNGLKEIVAAGFGFLLVKTSIFEKLEKPYVRLGELDPEQWSDDIGFFKRVREAGIKSHCDMNCWVGHLGGMIVWPHKENGVWYTSYDTGGAGRINTPQMNANLVSKLVSK